MPRLVWIITISFGLLAGCASRPPPLEAPDIQIVELTMAQPGTPTPQSYDLSVRVRNTSEVELIVSNFEFELLLDGQSAGTYSPQIEVAIGILSNENVKVSGQLDALQAQSLVALQEGRRSQIPYTLTGTMLSEGRSFDLRYEGWLSRSPGKSGSFR